MLQVAATNQSLHSDARPAPLGVALMIIPSTISTHTFTIMVAVGRQDACDWFRHKQAAAAAKRGYPTMRERLRQPGDKAALQHQAHARHPRDTAPRMARAGYARFCQWLRKQSFGVKGARSGLARTPPGLPDSTDTAQTICCISTPCYVTLRQPEGCDLSWVWTPGLSRAAS